MTDDQIAQVTHEANAAYCRALGDASQPPWDVAPDWQRTSAVNGVRSVRGGKHEPSESHESWMREKLESGWTHGPVKDEKQKTHPCLVPYAELPPEQRVKDHLFVAVARALL